MQISNTKVLTAAHVVDNAQPPSRIRISYPPKYLYASIKAIGDKSHTDLAILEIEQGQIPIFSFAPHQPICDKQASLYSRGYVHTVGDKIETNILLETADNPYVDASNTNTNAYLTTKFWPGFSGSPVYEKDTGCLRGIISRVDEQEIKIGILGKPMEYRSTKTRIVDVSEFKNKITQ